MSEPTYRIEVERHVKESARSHMAWRASIYRVADDRFLMSGWGHTALEALADARQLCARLGETPAGGGTFYADENGEPVPQSLRVAP